jgi:beta-glucanase (GH16 family)
MLPRSFFSPASALLASLIASPVLAQLHTDCNPTLKDCPADAAFATAHTFNFNSTPATGLWNTSAGTVGYDAENGASFTISKKGYSPTLTSNFYFFWGRTEVIMKAANGTGIISSIVWGSDDLDEVDWEFRGTDTANAQSNYYGKGVTNSSSGGTHAVTGNVQTEWHNYTNVWTDEKLEWWIDGALVRTLTPAAANSSRNYPQTPMKLMLGIWAGGDSSQAAGTIEWAGGATDYDNGPYTMYVKSARVEDYSKGTEYSYGDRTGSSSSIKITQ